MSTSQLAVVRSRAVIANKSKSFALASRLLPPECRDDVVIIYAFCRHVDDAIDLVAPEKRSAALAELRCEIDCIYGEIVTNNDVLDAFGEVVRKNSIPRIYVDELLAGMKMDVDRAAYDSIDDLLLYGYRVAGVVGLLLCHVMKIRDASALRNAAHLGIAMQLTNISRDVLEDLEDGRVYLPSQWLGSPLTNPPTPGARDNAIRVVERLLVLADRFYASADLGIDALPFRCALAVRTARYIYAAIGDRLRASGGDPFSGRVVVPRLTKLRLVARAFFETLWAWPHPRGARARTPDMTIRFWRDVVPEGELDA
ncbi:MAG: phytoene/squalene synthase family protein [Polyangiaceae bacterium]